MTKIKNKNPPKLFQCKDCGNVWWTFSLMKYISCPECKGSTRNKDYVEKKPIGDGDQKNESIHQ